MDSEGTLYQRANFDPLRGVPNRHRMIEHFESTILSAKRSSKKFSILFIDVNYFKPNNDTYGHSAGDAVLIEIAKRLNRLLREDKLLARYGGDEFVWISNASLTKKDLAHLASRMKKEFKHTIKYRIFEFRIGLSMGSATYPDDGETASSLLDIADKRMYLDKKRLEKV